VRSGFPSAVRETSVVFAAFIGQFFLGVELTPRRRLRRRRARRAICLGYQA
jgi:hypothetical protein